ncbi:MAG: hypothetical protein J6Y65_01180 [Eggerthellaceae bacterium]|nr:hypothetical protein [Eggerthellaceae bacterium]
MAAQTKDAGQNNGADQSQVDPKWVKPVIAWSILAAELVLAIGIGLLVCLI